MSSVISASTTSSTALTLSGDTSGQLEIKTGSTPSTAVTIDSSQNVGIGTSTITSNAGWTPRLVLSGTSAAAVVKGINSQEVSVGSSDGMYIDCLGNTTGSNNNIIFRNTASNSTFSATERMRITSGGNVLIGTSNASLEAGVGFKFVASSTQPYIGIVVNGDVSNYHVYNTNAVNNGYRFYVNANGGISNYSGNNVNLSDERTKTNIELASSYLDKICAIPVKTFNYKDESTGEQKTLGVIAQDVEVVAPEFVDKDGWKGKAPEGEEPLKSIYTTDLMFALMKSIQELNAKVEAQAAEIALLKSK